VHNDPHKVVEIERHGKQGRAFLASSTHARCNVVVSKQPVTDSTALGMFNEHYCYFVRDV